MNDVAGKNDAFGEDPRHSLKRYLANGITSFKTSFCVRTLAYSDIHAFLLEDLIEILDTYPDFAVEFLRKFTVAFNLKPEVSMKLVFAYIFFSYYSALCETATIHSILFHVIRRTLDWRPVPTTKECGMLRARSIQRNQNRFIPDSVS